MGSILLYIKYQLKKKFWGKICLINLLSIFSPVILAVLIYKFVPMGKEEVKVNISYQHFYITVLSYISVMVLNINAVVDLLNERRKYRKQHLIANNYHLFNFHFSWYIIYAILLLPSAIVNAILAHLFIFPHTSVYVVFGAVYLINLSNVTISFLLAGIIPYRIICSICVILMNLAMVATYVSIEFYARFEKNIPDGNSYSSSFVPGYIFNKLKLKEVDEKNVVSSLRILSYFSTAFSNSVIFAIFGFIFDLCYTSSHMIRSFRDRTNSKKFCQTVEKEANRTLVNDYEHNNMDKVVEVSDIFKSLSYSEKKNLSYSNNEELIDVNNITFSVYQNEIFAITGGKGDGQNTLMKVIYGRLSSSYGIVLINDKKLDYWRWKGISKSISVSPKEDYVFYKKLSVKEHFEIYGKVLVNAVDDGVALLKALNFRGNVNENVEDLDPVEKSKVKIALAFVKNTQIIFLEEPTLGMGDEDKNAFWNVVNSRRKNKTIIFSTSSINEASKNANRYLILDKGSMISIKKGYQLDVNSPALDIRIEQ